MENDTGDFVDLYCPRKWWVTIRNFNNIFEVRFTLHSLNSHFNLPKQKPWQIFIKSVNFNQNSNLFWNLSAVPRVTGLFTQKTTRRFKSIWPRSIPTPDGWRERAECTPSAEQFVVWENQTIVWQGSRRKTVSLLRTSKYMKWIFFWGCKLMPADKLHPKLVPCMEETLRNNAS